MQPHRILRISPTRKFLVSAWRALARAWCSDDLVSNQDHGAGNMNRKVWVRITGALLLAGHWSLAGASALSDAAAALQPGQWVQLSTQNFNSQLLVDGNYDLFYYTEDMTWDPVSRQLLFVGGGHDNDADFLRYSEATNT